MALQAGVIGLGNIGGGVARNLAAAGHSVIGYDIDTDLISARGVREAEDAAERYAAEAAAIELVTNEEKETLLAFRAAITDPDQVLRNWKRNSQP